MNWSKRQLIISLLNNKKCWFKKARKTISNSWKSLAWIKWSLNKSSFWNSLARILFKILVILVLLKQLKNKRNIKRIQKLRLNRNVNNLNNRILSTLKVAKLMIFLINFLLGLLKSFWRNQKQMEENKRKKGWWFSRFLKDFYKRKKQKALILRKNPWKIKDLNL